MSVVAYNLIEYTPTCSDVNFKDYSVSRSNDYDPTNGDYFRDAIEKDAIPGLAIAATCLLIAILLFLGSLCLCCIPHHWRQQRPIHRLVEGHKCKRFFSSLLMAGITVNTLAIIALSTWGIYETIDKVENAVDSSFDLVEQTENRVDLILSKTTEAVDVGRRIVAAMDKVNKDLGADANIRLAATFDVVDVDDERAVLREATVIAKDALDTADKEVNDVRQKSVKTVCGSLLNRNLLEMHDLLKDVLEFEDEGQTGSTVLRVLVIVSFSIFIFMALVIGCCSVLGKSAKLTYCSVVLMWLVLFVAFALGVGILNAVRKISESSCLYIDEFAIREITDAVDMDSGRIEELLKVYFQPVGTNNLNNTEIENLWELPLSDIEGFLDTIDNRLFTREGDLTGSALFTTQDTQQSLRAARKLFPEVGESILAVRNITAAGGILNKIHAGVKDLLCCTYHGSIESIFNAWVFSSAAGFVLAVLVTWQVLSFVKFDKSHDKYQQGPPPPQAIPAQGQSAYMQSTNATAHYPPVQAPPVIIGNK